MNNVIKGDESRNKILNIIIEYFEQHGYAPSIRELCEITGLKSTSTIHNHIKVMLECGMLETDSEWGTPRAIRVPGYKFIKVD